MASPRLVCSGDLCELPFTLITPTGGLAHLEVDDEGAACLVRHECSLAVCQGGVVPCRDGCGMVGLRMTDVQRLLPMVAAGRTHAT